MFWHLFCGIYCVSIYPGIKIVTFFGVLMHLQMKIKWQLHVFWSQIWRAHVEGNYWLTLILGTFNLVCLARIDGTSSNYYRKNAYARNQLHSALSWLWAQYLLIFWLHSRTHTHSLIQKIQVLWQDCYFRLAKYTCSLNSSMLQKN